MKVAIYSRVLENDQHNEVQFIDRRIKRKHIEPVIYHSFFEKMQAGFPLPATVSVFRESSDLDASIDFMISLGGDGTLLDTVSLVRDKNIPVLGINFGRLGFLASIGKEELRLWLPLWSTGLL